jgi:heme-degrading monooxygenase HmoA
VAELLACPPPPDVLPAMLAIPGMTVTPGILATQEGPDGHLGPEAAGAILILQATFNDADKAHAFWHTTVGLMELLATAPGFIRRYSFPDGLSITLIALWRSVADAKAFAATPEHRAAVRELYRNRWQYSHFAALWEMTANHQRMIFCDECDGVSAAADRVCGTCGAKLVDVYTIRRWAAG